MGSIQDSPVFVKSMCALLILFSIVDILLTYVCADFTGLTGTEKSQSFISLLIYSAVTVGFIIFIYGVVAGSWKCWVISVLLLLLRTTYHTALFVISVDMIPVILSVASVIILFIPKMLRYEFRDFFSEKNDLKAEQKDEE